MFKTTERRTVLTLGKKITRINIIDEGTAVEIFSISNCAEHQEETYKEEIKGTQEYIEKYFPIVKASTLSLEDEFLTHIPETESQVMFKERLIRAIESGLSDFRAQRMDASFDEEGRIYFKAGMKPAVGKSLNWWKQATKEFMPEKGSRLGKIKERTAFLALLIKCLIEEKGYTVSDAWKAVCDDSKELGHYRNSKNAKVHFEPTGSRKVGEWYDLANTFKIILNDNDIRLVRVGGSCRYDSCRYPLYNLFSFVLPNEICDYVGWIVLSA